VEKTEQKFNCDPKPFFGNVNKDEFKLIENLSFLQSYVVQALIFPGHLSYCLPFKKSIYLIQEDVYPFT